MSRLFCVLTGFMTVALLVPSCSPVRTPSGHRSATKSSLTDVRLAMDKRCPKSVPIAVVSGAKAVESEGPGLSKELVPPGANHLRVCRYMVAPPEQDHKPVPPPLASSMVTSSQVEIEHLKRLLDSFAPVKKNRSLSCPAERRPDTALAAFSYPGGSRTVIVDIRLSGCLLASNGAGVYRPDNGDKLLAEMNSLVPLSRRR